MDLDFNKIIEEKAKEFALEHVKTVVEAELKDYIDDNLDEYVRDLVEKNVDDAINSNDFNLEEAVTTGISKAIMPWISNNFYQGDIQECIKEAIIFKLRDYNLEDLIKFAETLKK